MGTFDHLGRALRWLREERGLRQYHLAEEAAITKAMLSSYETGRQNPSLETLDKVLRALGCDLHELADTLDAFAGKQGPPRERASPPRRPPVPVEPSSTEVDVYRLLGLSERLPAGEEAAMEQVVSGFHKLLRHMHERVATSVAPQTSGEPPESEGSEE